MNNETITSVIEKVCPTCDDKVPVNFFEAFKAKCTICGTVIDYSTLPPPINVKPVKTLEGADHISEEIRSSMFPDWWSVSEPEKPKQEEPKLSDPFEGAMFDTTEGLQEGRNIKPITL